MLDTTKELIPISENNGKRAVNARGLHAFLESKRDFSTWIKDRIKSYDFVEGVDFQSFTEIVEREVGATTRIEYALSISMAKELSMIENNERGKQARKYFITCEENKHELSRKELALMVLQSEEEKERLALEVQQKQETIELQQKELTQAAPKVEYCDKVLSSKGYLTVNMISACLGISDIKLNKLLCQWGIQYKESGVYYLYSKYRDKGYTVHKPHAYTDSLGNIKTRQHMYWTEMGKKFILNLYHKKMEA